MWYRIYGEETVAAIKEGDKLLCHPTDEGQRQMAPTGEENNSQVYEVKELLADSIVICAVGETLGYAVTMTKTVSRNDLLRSKWWWWMEE